MSRVFSELWLLFEKTPNFLSSIKQGEKMFCAFCLISKVITRGKKKVWQILPVLEINMAIDKIS